MLKSRSFFNSITASIPEGAKRGFRHILWIAAASSLAILIGEYLINRIYFGESGFFIASHLAVFGNIFIFFLFLWILLALTNRLFPSIIIGLSIYALLIFSDILKLKSFDNPLSPTDLQYLTDLKVLAKSFLNPKTLSIALTLCIVIIVLCIVLWKKKRSGLLAGARLWTGFLAATLIALCFIVPSITAARQWLNAHGIELPEAWQFEARASAQMNGLLVEWAMSALNLSFSRPEHYTQSEIDRITRDHTLASRTQNLAASEHPPNLIIFIIESFMDPLDLKLRYTSDPIPTFHKISRKWSSGEIVVPVFGGTSANTEFEMLTGLSMYFLPEASCPYRKYIKQDIPSLPRLLHQHSYRTIAIPADPPYLFNRREILPRLGFDNWIFPEADPKTPRSQDDEFAADEAIVDAIITASSTKGPFFIEAFTGGSHYPWEYSDFEKSSLDIVGPMTEPNRSRLKNYINALRVADNALKKLLAYFEKSNRKTVILILGDHLPPLGSIYDKVGFFRGKDLDKIRKRYQVPMALWTNYPAVKEDFVCSANFIPARLLQVLGLPPTGSLALSADVYSRFPVFSKYVQTADGRLFSPQSSALPFKQLIDDYHRIQYDLLAGRQYALTVPGWRWDQISQ